MKTATVPRALVSFAAVPGDSCSSLALALALVACDTGPPPAQAQALPALPRAASPRLDEVAVLATHNAYWVDRRAPNDLFASGVSERLVDQLAFDGVRSLELDVHNDLRVYHTVPGNSLCATLRDCLEEVRAFTWAAPNHHPLILVVELKELFAPNFDATHRPEDLDRALRGELHGALYTPADLLARCPGDTTLSACVARAGWPPLAELRGRILVTLLGNWDDLGAQATADWATYATGDITTRAAFPMASSWKLSIDQLPPRLREQLDQPALDRALAQSAFLQVESLDDPRLSPFLAGGGIVRANGADGVAAQDARLALGVQLLQTDTPWQRAPSVGPAADEPGRRIYLSAEPGEEIFAHHESSGPFALQALVATGRTPPLTSVPAHLRALFPTVTGCLRAAGSDDGDRLTICREKPWTAAGPDAERTTISAEMCTAGACSSTIHPGLGDLIALVGDDRGCVEARAGRTTDPFTGRPQLTTLLTWCPTRPISRRGIVRGVAPVPTTVGFFGLDTAPFTAVQATRGGATYPAQARLVDATR